MRKIWIALPLGLAVAVSAMVAVHFYRSDRYELIKPRIGPITEAVYGLGRVKSIHRYDLKLGVTSTIRHLWVREGDYVKAGTKLIEVETGAVFKAPFDGTVTLVSSYVGETVSAQATLLRLEDLTDRFIELSLEQEGALRVKRGQEAKISFETLRGKTLTGKVFTLFPREDEFLAHIKIADLSESVLPGMTADVSVEVGQITSALLIPVKAIHSGFVVVRRGRRDEKVRVDVGRVDGIWAEIKGNSLNETDDVLVPKTEAK